MSRAVVNTVVVTVLATLGSIAITTLVDVVYPSSDLRFALTLATLCPLLLAPPLSYWNFRNGELIRRLNAELEAANERLVAANSRLEDYVIFDGMTGLMNRSAFFAGLEEGCHQTGGSMVMIDADRFKAINDTHGHSTGDEVLILIADAIRELAHTQILAGRLGGEEFAMFLPGIEEDQASSYAEALRRSVEKRTQERANGAITATISLGVAAATAGVKAGELYRAADQALYAAKRSGRNRVCRAGTTIRPRSTA